MAKKVRIILLGDGIIKEKIKNLSDSEAKNVIQSACREAMKWTQKEAKKLAPKKTGALRRSIRVRATKRSRVRIGARVTTSASDNMYSGKTFYGAFLEYGWKTKGRKDANRRAASAMTRRLTRSNARQGRLSPFASERALQQVRLAEYADKQTANRKPKERREIKAREYMKRAIDRTKDECYEIFGRMVDVHIRKVMAKRKTKALK
jgi:hypothetical protein